MYPTSYSLFSDVYLVVPLEKYIHSLLTTKKNRSDVSNIATYFVCVSFYRCNANLQFLKGGRVIFMNEARNFILYLFLFGLYEGES